MAINHIIEVITNFKENDPVYAYVNMNNVCMFKPGSIDGRYGLQRIYFQMVNGERIFCMIEPYVIIMITGERFGKNEK